MASGDSGMLKWVTIFDKKNEKDSFGVKIPEIPDDDPMDGAANGLQNGDAGDKKSKSNKRLSVERIYQKKTQLEHILLRPDTYIGSVESVTQPMWVYDEMSETMVQRELTFVPGLYKIFDEILVNAADNKQRDPKMNCIKIDIDAETNKIKIWNNGKGIPIVKHKTEGMYVPTLIFGHLLTSSNYDDTEKKVTGGRNGYGAKLCNIFSNKFSVETQCHEYKSAFRQSWGDNMNKAGDPKILPSKGEDYTCITFCPDLKRFGMEKLDQDTVDLFARRAYDIAASIKGVKVFLNGKKVPVKNFKDYIDLYIKGKVDDNGIPIKMCHEIVNDRWEIGIALSEKGFQQASFVNSIATTKGGRHIDYITDQCVSKLIETVKKKEKKGGVTQIKPFQVKTHIWIFCNCLIENPTFDSQTKENMTLQAKNFGSKCAISEKFINQMAKCGIVESIQSWMKFKAQEKMNKKCSSAKHSKLKGIPKLDDANNAGTKNSLNCTLILTEGDSAKSLAVSGLGVVGRDQYGVFPLRGKLLNVREASPKQIMENAEINNLIKIMGLRYKEKYEDPETLKTLRYGKIMIMTDQDQDGSHIKGLLINFIHNNWPGLLKHNFLEEFITPIVKVTKGKTERSFYSLPEFEEWKKNTDNWHTYRVKYYKGLGTSSSKEAKEYFSDMDRHRIPFKYAGPEDDASILLAFSKKKIEERKEWLTNWMEERKRRDQLELPELYLYGKETKNISYNEFVNRELILFSNMDNERSIPCLVDGLKPGQRKVLFTCFKRNLIKEMKVAQLAGSVAEHSAYHHGEMSLMMTIINLAQNFVGSNNINLLTPNGQFGTRLHGGKDAASPRYIFTQLSTLARHIYNVNDEALLKFNFDDGQRIEPQWYIPIIPMVLVNGSEGIGTGWSTKIPNYDPREVVRNLIRMIDGMEPVQMNPWFKGFIGTIESIDDTRDAVSGEVSVIDDTTIEITELPIRTWTQQYKESVLEPMLQGTDKTPALITDYKEYHTDKTVKFAIQMTREKLAQSEDAGLHKVFKLQTTISKGSMVLFDHNGVIKRYTDVLDILREFFTLRLDFYQRRKDYLEGMLSAESLRLDNIARFIMEKIEGTIVIENKPKKELIQILVRRGYDSDPVKTWKATQVKLMSQEAAEEDDDDASSVASEAASGPDFNYLLGMALWCLTKERKDELLKNRDSKTEELYQLRKKTPSDMWRADLDALIKELDVVEAQEKVDDEMTITKQVKTAKGRAKVQKVSMDETKPSFGRRIEPTVDAALKAKVEAAARAKSRKIAKKEKGDLNDMEFMDDDDDMGTGVSLADRIGGSPAAVGGAPVKKEKKPREPKAPKEPKEPKEKKEKKPREKKAPGVKKGKKRNPWSDSESDKEEFSDSDDDDLGTPSKIGASPVQRSPRRAATKAKYTFSDEESEQGFKSSEDEDFSSAPPKKQTKFSDSEQDDDDEEDLKPAAPAPKPRVPSPVIDSGSDSDSYKPSIERSAPSTGDFPASPVMLGDSDDEQLFIEKEKPPVKKPAAPKKPAAKTKVDDKQPSIFDAVAKAKPKKDVFKNDIADPVTSDSDGENGVDEWLAITKPTITKKSTKKPAAAAAKYDSDSDGDFPPKKAAPPKKKAAPKKKKSSDVSDFSDEDVAPKPKKAPAKKRKPKKPLSDMSDLSDEGMLAKPAKKKGKKAAGSDGEDEFMPKKVKTKAAKKKKPGSSDEDDFNMDFEPKAAPSRGGRAKAPVKYTFEDSDEDSDF